MIWIVIVVVGLLIALALFCVAATLAIAGPDPLPDHPTGWHEWEWKPAYGPDLYDQACRRDGPWRCKICTTRCHSNGAGGFGP
jgi:hypothetical protein